MARVSAWILSRDWACRTFSAHHYPGHRVALHSQVLDYTDKLSELRHTRWIIERQNLRADLAEHGSGRATQVQGVRL